MSKSPIKPIINPIPGYSHTPSRDNIMSGKKEKRLGIKSNSHSLANSNSCNVAKCINLYKTWNKT
jgi:hypothetical protein